MSFSSYWFSFMGSSTGNWVSLHSIYGTGKIFFYFYLRSTRYEFTLQITYNSSVHEKWSIFVNFHQLALHLNIYTSIHFNLLVCFHCLKEVVMILARLSSW